MAVQYRREEQTKGALIVKIAVIALALAGALYLALRGNPDQAQLDTPESADPYICLNCGQVFKVTPAEFERLASNGGIHAPSDPEGAGVITLRCPKCGQLAGVRAYPCPNDQTMFPRRLEDGRPGRCPKCGWSFYAR